MKGTLKSEGENESKIYTGEFKNSLPHGYGKEESFLDEIPTLILEGYFKKNELIWGMDKLIEDGEVNQSTYAASFSEHYSVMRTMKDS
jgi:hypothetical protein